MNSRKLMRALAVLLLIAFAAQPIRLVQAQTPAEPHNRNAVWIEPSLLQLNISQISPNYKFNVTIWANCSASCGGWQAWLLYDKTYVNATNIGYTAETKSDFFQNISTIPINPALRSHNATFNRAEYGESWSGSGPFRSPGYGSLAWVEFNVTSLPINAQDVLLSFYATSGTQLTRRTYLINATAPSATNKVDLNAYYGTIRFLTAAPDVAPPLISIISPENKTYTTNTDLKYTTNEPTSWVGYSLDGQVNVTISGNMTIPNLAEGPHTVVVYANDTIGNMGVSPSVSFTVAPPLISIISPENKTYTTNTDLKYTTNEPTSWVGYSLDGNASVTILGNTTIANLTEGQHTIVVYANDTGGNMGVSPSVSFTVNLHGIPEDLTGNGLVDVDDIFAAALCFGSVKGDARYDERADIDGNGRIDIMDMWLIATKFGTEY